MSNTATTTLSITELQPLKEDGSKTPVNPPPIAPSSHALSTPPQTLPDRPGTVKLVRANLIILQVSLFNFLASLTTGLIVVGLPRIASDLHLAEQLYLWPSSVYGLTAGSTLLIAGAIADVVGARSVDLLGCTLLGVFTLACGFSRTGVQLVVFRALQGIAVAMHQPCSVALVALYVPSGKRRNVGFACLGMSMILGFSVGLVLGGVLIDTIGWRFGFYLTGAVMLLQAIAGFKIIPVDSRPLDVWKKLRSEIDWVGAFIISAGLAMFNYVLAILSADSRNIENPTSIALLVLSTVLLLAFPVWMHRQASAGRPALVPNHLWKKLAFSTVCVVLAFAWAVINAMELFSSLYFQEVQEFSALQTSLRLLPMAFIGAFLNLTTGYIADRAPTFWLIFVSTLLTAGAPLVMALIDPDLSYWKGAFFAQTLAPFACDTLFTVGLIIVSEVFPEKEQALAGAVFNTIANFGQAMGMNLLQVVSLLVTEGTTYRDKSSPDARLQGYQASFWAMFAMTMTCAVVAVIGLRNVGKIGLKRD